ncbi:MAG: hypothetical protein M1813_007156 [Trichoglossum hirsutum]|nr:MAG: hypothetical protein M1813_007156 [Trichoglossum hirsutum]
MPIRPIVKLVPAGNHRTMKVLVLKGDADRPAGIPLSHSGMKLMDQTTPGLFEEQKSVKIELNSENDCIQFCGTWQNLLNQWRGRCDIFNTEQDLKRNEKVLTIPTTRFEPKKVK